MNTNLLVGRFVETFFSFLVVSLGWLVHWQMYFPEGLKLETTRFGYTALAPAGSSSRTPLQTAIPLCVGTGYPLQAAPAPAILGWSWSTGINPGNALRIGTSSWDVHRTATHFRRFACWHWHICQHIWGGWLLLQICATIQNHEGHPALEDSTRRSTHRRSTSMTPQVAGGPMSRGTVHINWPTAWSATCGCNSNHYCRTPGSEVMPLILEVFFTQWVCSRDWHQYQPVNYPLSNV